MNNTVELLGYYGLDIHLKLMDIVEEYEAN